MIQVQHLTKRFGQLVAVDDVSFTLSKGDTMGLLGPNGAGKTTIMRMMTGYLPPTEGRVLIEGMDMYDQPAEVKRKIGYLPEHPPLYMDMTVREYLEFVAEIKGLPKARLKDAVQKAAEQCGVADKLGRLIGNLSKGNRQRVGLAQALVHEPEILILDEPTVGLDPKQIIEIRNLIKELGRHRTVILSTHILQEVTAVCNKVAIINNGRLVVCDYIDRLSDKLSGKTNLRLRVLRPENFPKDKLQGLDGVFEVKQEGQGWFVLTIRNEVELKEEISRVVVSEGAGLLEMRPETFSVEDIFLKVVSSDEQSSLYPSEV
ncbi:MAG: ATP-binding cassette domain-containing protein [Nitrospirae bacterium]|nr:MAG: ATP-binding cassette domain-containing protein [Nitrospirota bacterium]